MFISVFDMNKYVISKLIHIFSIVVHPSVLGDIENILNLNRHYNGVFTSFFWI